MSSATHRSYEEALRAEQRRCDQRATALAGLIARELERAEEIDRLLERDVVHAERVVNA